jgi:hypothetical protein
VRRGRVQREPHDAAVADSTTKQTHERARARESSVGSEQHTRNIREKYRAGRAAHVMHVRGLLLSAHEPPAAYTLGGGGGGGSSNVQP